MPENKMPRHQIPPALAQRFITEYDEVLQYYNHEQRLDISDHLLEALELITEYVTTNEEENYRKYQRLENKFLEKHGSTLKPYIGKSFYKYFQFDIVLAEKNIVSTELFNAMAPEEQSLTLNDKEQFLRLCKNALYQKKDYLYLEFAGHDISPVTLNNNFTVTDEPDRDITKARQLLAIYYFLKASLGIEGRDSSSISGIARFIHLLTGTKFTTIQNSDIYKKYLQMPNYKKDAQLITDLKFIRPYFTDLNIDSAVKMIDDEMKRAVSELPFGERKHYTNDKK